MVSYDDNPFTSSKKHTTGLTAQVAPPVALPRSIKRPHSTTTANETMQSNANTSNHTTNNSLKIRANASTSADNNMNTTVSTHISAIDYHQADTRITSNQTVSSMQANATDRISKTNDSNADMPTNINNANMPADNANKPKRKHHRCRLVGYILN